MLTLHLDIIPEKSAATSAAAPAAFRGERSVGLDGTPVPLAGDELLEAVCEVVWFKDEVRLDAGCAIPSMRNLLMFLSDVRTRRFKTGVFLGDDVLAAAEVFRDAVVQRQGRREYARDEPAREHCVEQDARLLVAP